MEMLSKEIYNLATEYRSLVGSRIPTQPGQPATEQQIQLVEKAFHCSLPESYRLFLSIHNGWQNWSGDVALLSTEQMLAGKYVERIKEWREETREFNP